MTLILRGTIDHLPIWFFYSFVNYTGLVFCAIYAYSLFRDKRYFNAVDIGVLNLLSGIFVMCIFCATQCLRNLVGWSQYFQDWGAGIGCSLEAIGHVLAIMVQFMAVTQVAYYQYRTVQRGQLRGTLYIAIRPHSAIAHTICIWMYSVGGTLLTLVWTKTQLLPAGSYCFPEWTSPMTLWLAMTMVLSLTSAIYYYIRVFEITNEIAEKVAMQQHYNNDPLRKVRNAARRSVYLMLGYAFGWGFVPIAAIWAWTTGDITQPLELLVGIFGSLHSWFVPLIYGKQSLEVKKFIRRCGTYKCCPACVHQTCEECFPELEERPKNKEGDVTVVLRRHQSNHLPRIPQQSRSNNDNSRQTLTMSSMMPLPPPMTILITTEDQSPPTGSPNTDPGRIKAMRQDQEQQLQYSPTPPSPDEQQQQQQFSPTPPSEFIAVKVAWPQVATA